MRRSCTASATASGQSGIIKHGTRPHLPLLIEDAWSGIRSRRPDTYVTLRTAIVCKLMRLTVNHHRVNCDQVHCVDALAMPYQLSCLGDTKFIVRSMDSPKLKY